MNTNWKIILLPFSFLYSIIIFLRNLFFDIKIFRVKRVNIPVISVGNLSVGGTGKTPVIEFLLNVFRKQNIKAAVISRGYKRSTKGMLIVSDGNSVKVNPEEAGDEPYQIAKKFNNTIVIVDENRYRGAQAAVDMFKAQVILLDDGFQHRKIHRDLNILLIDVTQLPHKEYILPAGLRRETLSSIKRADILLFTRWNDNATVDVLKYKDLLYGKICFEPMRFVKFYNGEIINTAMVKDKSCSAFCGIGNPDSFEIFLKDLGINITSIRKFPDHHKYRLKDLELIKSDFNSAVDMIITTEKDYVRLMEHKNELASLPLYYLEISTRFIEGESKLIEKIQNLKVKE